MQRIPHQSAPYGKNRCPSPIVWTFMMASTYVACRLEDIVSPIVVPLRATRARFTELAQNEIDRAFRLAGLILGNQAEAEDAVGDALMRGWAAADALRTVHDFQPWFDRILVNICRDRLRRRARIRFVQLEAGHDRLEPTDAFRDLIERDELLAAVARLQPDERIVLILHIWADLTLATVADRLDCPIGTVKSRLHRALATLRVQISTDTAHE